MALIKIDKSYRHLFQAVESLSLADSKLRNHLSVIINALGSNTTLTEIDIRYMNFI